MDWYAGLERTRAAVALVLHDVEYEFGSDAATIVFESPEKVRIGGPHGWVIGIKSKVALGGELAEAPWEYLVVRTAEDIQEVIQQDRERPFPRCPSHSFHPLTAQIASGVASWTCPQRSIAPIAIGALGEWNQSPDSQ